jgi:ABC-type multidrug transport system ATPase subunit/peptidoglycan/LPS O-acetylase OafA/YrhL
MSSTTERLHALDAVRAFALLLGIVFHATMSFLPGFGDAGWPIADVSPSTTLSVVFFSSHMFRMTTFFFIAGFFARLVLQRRGTGAFFRERSKRILVPFVVGWPIAFAGITAAFVWAIAKSGAAAAAPEPSADTILAFPLTHLWFLYVLFLFYVLFVPARAAFVRFVDRSGEMRTAVDRAVGVVMRSGLAPALLALPVTAALLSAAQWQVWGGIPTPDYSLVPNLPAFVGYGVAFSFGWVLHRQAGALDALFARWPFYLAAGIALNVWCLTMVGPTMGDPELGDRLPLYALAYTTGGWCWTIGLTGASLAFLNRERPVVRYLADSSYWLYLLHLPLVFALQVLVMEWALHWAIKYTLVLGVAMIVLLLTYDLLVRSTYIGEVLNGRRYPRALARRQPARVPAPVYEGSMPLAELRSVEKAYGGTPALRGVDLKIGAGELVALLGANGAGKTTAIALWLGLREPDAGDVLLFGKSPHELAVRRRIGVMMQEVALPPELRVRELIAQTASYYPQPYTVEEILALTHTGELADRSYSKLSGGQKRQAQFALAVCGRPRLLFLDEPTVGLDIEARERMWRTIRSLIADGCSVLLTTHYLEEAEALADRVIVLAHGRVIAQGSVNEVRRVVSRRRITCTTLLSEADVRGWPGVQSVERRDDRLHIVATEGEDTVRRLLASDAALTDLEVHRGGLAEALTELTEEHAT